MSVTIRLARIGKRNAPAYKIVVANTRDKRNGRFLDILGHYNPSHSPPLLDIDKKKVDEWKGKGALSTDAVEKLIAETYEFVPYTRQNEPEDKKKVEKEKVPEGGWVQKASEEEAPTKDESKADETAKPSEEETA